MRGFLRLKVLWFTTALTLAWSSSAATDLKVYWTDHQRGMVGRVDAIRLFSCPVCPTHWESASIQSRA